MKKALIIGAGFSGCMPAFLLKQKGWDVTVFEKASYIGGGVRTFFHGGHPYTFGPRHFLSPHKEAYDWLSQYVPMRDLIKVNYTFIEADQEFYTYPIHEDDIDKMPERDMIRKELASLDDGHESKNFEEFWQHRVGNTLYSKFVKEYNKKAWQVQSNTEVDFGFVATVKRKPLETGPRHEFRDWYNCYPTPLDGYNKFFDIALEGCNVLLNTTITNYDIENKALWVGDKKYEGDIIVSTTSPDIIMDNQFGELKYVGREFHKIVLPIERIFPENVYFIYYPNGNEQHTRVVEYKQFTQYKSPYTLLGLEVPSLKNKLYPTLIQEEVDKAQKYIDALPEDVYSVGRMGTYRYIDIDDIILQNLEWVKQF